MQSKGVAEHDYGTNCKHCERYKTLGDVCVVEHGKKFLWEFCKDFEPLVVLPDYKELMRTVRSDMALERKRAKEKKERDRKKKLKERQLALEAKKKARRARLRKKRLREKEKQLRLERKLQKNKHNEKQSLKEPSETREMLPTSSKEVKHVRAKKTSPRKQSVAGSNELFSAQMNIKESESG
ncbi:MAG: hypothetical protein JRN52_11980 [Nitrososphaerota archaeon]|nr:hypothetical protein [Nitrososphaerota archaeon]